MTQTALPTRSAGTQATLLFDADGDGDLDLLFGDQNAANRLLVRQRQGRLPGRHFATQMPADQDNTKALAAVDVDGDKDLDLVIANDRNGNDLLLNDGKGRFSARACEPVPQRRRRDASASAVGDLNGDGRPDVFFANALGANRIYLNQGSARFVDATNQLPAPNNGAQFAVALGDVDEDGDLDAVLATSFGQNQLWLNDGKGSFSDATSRLLTKNDATTAALLRGRRPGRRPRTSSSATAPDPSSSRTGCGTSRHAALPSSARPGSSSSHATMASPAHRRSPPHCSRSNSAARRSPSRASETCCSAQAQVFPLAHGLAEQERRGQPRPLGPPACRVRRHTALDAGGALLRERASDPTLHQRDEPAGPALTR